MNGVAFFFFWRLFVTIKVAPATSFERRHLKANFSRDLNCHKIFCVTRVLRDEKIFCQNITSKKQISKTSSILWVSQFQQLLRCFLPSKSQQKQNSLRTFERSLKTILLQALRKILRWPRVHKGTSPAISKQGKSIGMCWFYSKLIWVYGRFIIQRVYDRLDFILLFQKRAYIPDCKTF